jgi:hypothetical protein
MTTNNKFLLGHIIIGTICLLVMIMSIIDDNLFGAVANFVAVLLNTGFGLRLVILNWRDNHS